jgi:hypothetical protein
MSRAAFAEDFCRLTFCLLCFPCGFQTFRADLGASLPVVVDVRLALGEALYLTFDVRLSPGHSRFLHSSLVLRIQRPLDGAVPPSAKLSNMRNSLKPRAFLRDSIAGDEARGRTQECNRPGGATTATKAEIWTRGGAPPCLSPEQTANSGCHGQSRTPESKRAWQRARRSHIGTPLGGRR